MIAKVTQVAIAELIKTAIQGALKKIMNIERRYRDYGVPQHLLVQMLRGEDVSLEMDLPEGAEVISMHHDWAHNCLYFRVQHISFAEVPPGCEARKMPVTPVKSGRSFRGNNDGPELFIPGKTGTIVPPGFAPR